MGINKERIKHPPTIQVITIINFWQIVVIDRYILLCAHMWRREEMGEGTLNTGNTEQTSGALDASSANTVTTSIASSSVSCLVA